MGRLAKICPAESLVECPRSKLFFLKGFMWMSPRDSAVSWGAQLQDILWEVFAFAGCVANFLSKCVYYILDAPIVDSRTLKSHF